MYRLLGQVTYGLVMCVHPDDASVRISANQIMECDEDLDQHQSSRTLMAARIQRSVGNYQLRDRHLVGSKQLGELCVAQS